MGGNHTMNEEKKKKSRKWIIIVALFIVAVVAVLIAIIVPPILKRSEGEDVIEDDYIEDGGDYSDVGETSMYAGIVEAQKTLEINKDGDKKIAQLLVAVGDEVTEGQPLFSYDTTELALQLEQAKIELDSSGTDIADYNNQINALKSQLKEADDESMKLEIQMQISELNTQIRQSGLATKTKQAEIASLEKSIQNSTVTSTINGVVKTIQESSTAEGPYMTILATGNYRVKCKVDEMNVGLLSEGMDVTVHSRVDDTTWAGHIEKIDTEDKADSNGENNYYGGEESGESSTKYFFYVALDSGDGLLLGQHVFVEPVFGE